MVAVKMLAPTMNAAPPCRTARTIRKGLATSAATSPNPWRRLFPISSPCDCPRCFAAGGRSTILTRLPGVRVAARIVGSRLFLLVQLGELRAFQGEVVHQALLAEAED